MEEGMSFALTNNIWGEWVSLTGVLKTHMPRTVGGTSLHASTTPMPTLLTSKTSLHPCGTETSHIARMLNPMPLPSLIARDKLPHVGSLQGQ